LAIQYGIKSPPYLVFLHFGAKNGKVGLNVVWEVETFL